MKKTICFDFDGVIHSYTTPWKGAEIIPDPPIPGVKELIERLQGEGYRIVIHSTRCATSNGMMAMSQWLESYGFKDIQIGVLKPPAIAYVDDRAVFFSKNHLDVVYQQIKNLDR